MVTPNIQAFETMQGAKLPIIHLEGQTLGLELWL